MDPSNSATLSCISAVKTRKRKAPDRNIYVSMKIPAKRLYFTPPTHRQRWSLPESIIYYMAKNPRSAKVQEKLFTSCKYFHAINPIIVCSKLTYIVPENTDRGNDIWKIEQGGEQKIVELNKVSTKLWISDEIVIGFFNRGEDDVAADIKQNLASSAIKNIYRCEAHILKLRDQTISFNEYKLLSSKVEYMDFEKVTVTREDGSIVPFEELVEAAVNVTKVISFFDDNDTSVSSETVKNLFKISHLASLYCFGLFNLSSAFDIDTWFTYVKGNKFTHLVADFAPSLPELYQNRVEEIIDEIIDAPDRDYYPPRISYDEIDEEKCEKLCKISDSYRL